MAANTILVVDDEEGVRNALARSLRVEGYEVFKAEGAREGMELLATEHVDLIICDHKMPRMTGLEFLARVREDYPDTVRFMLTGQAEMDTVIAAINTGEVSRFVTKPWDDEDLKMMIRMALANLELARENRRLLGMVESQASHIKNLEDSHPGLMEVDRDSDGAIRIPDLSSSEQDKSKTVGRS